MKIFTRKGLERSTIRYYEGGFRDAVESLVFAIKSGDKVVLGNGMSFVGMKNTAPMTVVGNSTHIMNGLFTLDKKYKDTRSATVKIVGKLNEPYKT